MKTRCILFSLAAIFFAISCGKSPEEKPVVQPEIKIPAESQAAFSNGITFDSGSGEPVGSGDQKQSTTVKFTATETWSASVADTKASTWLSVQPTSGSAGTVVMTVTAQPNTCTEGREASVTIKCSTVTQKFTVKQAGVPNVDVSEVTLDKAELTLVEGQEAELKATVKPDDATDKMVTWTSSDEAVATVADGKVNAVKAGTATITAKAGAKEATCKVTVTAALVPVESIKLDKESLNLVEGAKATLTATVTPDNATDKTVTWTSSDEAIATVVNGEVTAVKEGTATITAKAGDKEATCKVTVAKNIIAVTSVTLDKTSLEMVEGDNATLIATVKPDDATDKTVTWSSSNESVATVAEGKVIALKEGMTTIQAVAGEKTAECSVHVKKKTVFSISPSSVILESDECSFEVAVQCVQGQYSIISKPSWVNEKSVNGRICQFEVEANAKPDERNGVVLFSGDGGVVLPLSIKQKGSVNNSFNWSGNFVHHSLFIDFTATWCGYSPMMDDAFEIANLQRPDRMHIVRMHSDSKSALYMEECGVLTLMYPLVGIPMGVLDGAFRITNEASSEKTANRIVDCLDKLTSILPVMTTVGWNSNLSGQRFSLDLSVYAKVAGTYKVTVLLTESNIQEEQNSIGEGIKKYTHNNVTRISVSHITGDIFHASTSNYIEKRSYSVDIPTQYNKDNMNIVVYVHRAYEDGGSSLPGFDYGGWYVDNCFVGKMGETLEPIVIDNPAGGSGGNEGIGPTQSTGF